MKKAILLGILFLFSISTVAFGQCDKAEARRLLNEIRDIYNLQYDSRENILYVDMQGGWHSLDIDTKNKLLRAIANMDACIHGKARHIYINAWGERVAEATPKGFRIIK